MPAEATAWTDVVARIRRAIRALEVARECTVNLKTADAINADLAVWRECLRQALCEGKIELQLPKRVR